MGRALGALIRQAGLAKTDVDGLCVSSFTLAPDSAVGLVQHLGMSPRWLDHIPMGGASGVARCGAPRAPCRPATPRSWPASRATPITWTRSATPSASSRASPRTPYPYGAGGPNASFALLTAHYMRESGATREDFGKLCVAQATTRCATRTR